MGAICKDCGQDMMAADACTKTRLLFTDNQIKERNTEHFEEPSGRCHDCNIKHGEVHHWGCDVERCPICGLQLISCDHCENIVMALE